MIVPFIPGLQPVDCTRGPVPQLPQRPMFDAHLVSSDRAGSAVVATPLRWPPPGLEALQGAAWRAVTILAAGTTLMTAPLLLSVATTQRFFSTGLFGASWWVPIAGALAGLVLVLFGIHRLTRVVLGGLQAVRHGHDWSTVAYVVSDARYDAGFLLQGHRQYAALEERERRMLLSARVTSVACYAAALLWTCLAFAAGVILAGRGMISTGMSLTLVVLAPAGVLAGIAMLAHFVEVNACRSLTKAWRTDETRERRLVDEVGDWRADRATRLINLTPATRRTVPARVLASALIVIALLLPLPVLTLAMASAMGPVLAHVAIPRYESMSARFAKAALLENYALPATNPLTPMEAGETLHALASIGTTAVRSPIEREPVRRYEPLPDIAPPATLPPLQMYGTQLMPRATSLTAAEHEHLERITAHASLFDFSRLARVSTADITGGRWNADAFGTASVFDLPTPSFSGIREVVHLHIARAILEVSRGQESAAEATLREVISVGLLIARESPTMIDLLVGNNIAANGAAALQSFYQTTGRTVDAEALRRPGAGIDRMEEYARSLRSSGDIDSGLQRSMAIAANESLPRGLRWESLLSIQVAAGCLNPHTVVFGQGPQYHEWLEQTRATLVRTPTEQALFDLTLRGTMLPEDLRPRADIVERVLGLTLGRTETAGACAALLTGLSSLN
jgi:hypothetical protein